MPVLPAQVLSVTELTHRVKGLLEERFPSVWVEGEISNVRSPSSGHIYFTLKDDGAQLAVVVFRGIAAKLNFKLKDGLQVIAFGDISVYERSGQYQLVARQLLPKGLGATSTRLCEELKQRLAKGGLFDSSRKRLIPRPAPTHRTGHLAHGCGHPRFPEYHQSPFSQRAHCRPSCPRAGWKGPPRKLPLRSTISTR